MSCILKNCDFFLEAYSPKGLSSLLDKFYDVKNTAKVYLITGSIGAISSVLIRSVADKIAEKGFCTQRISNALCSKQLDGVYFPELNVYISNGGEGGCISSEYPVAVEKTVSLTECLNNGAIEQNVEEIKKLFLEQAQAKTRASGFLSAAESLMNDTKAIAKRYTDFEKVSHYASRFARREFPVMAGKRGSEQKRFLSAITSRGIETYTSTITSLCERFYILADRYGAASSYLPGLIKSYALASGYDVISCFCPMSSGMTTEHLIVPQRKLCFYCENDYHPADFAVQRRISANRFTDIVALSEHKKRISFNRRAANEMMAQAVKLFGVAENSRRKLELIYLSCTDEAWFRIISDRICTEILS